MKVTIENWEDMSEDQRTEMVEAIWAQEDDRLPEWTNSRLGSIDTPLPVSPRKEAKLRSAITKLKMESV